MKQKPVVFFSEIEKVLVNYLFEYKVATTQQIARDIFPCTHKSSMVRTLHKLRTLGVIQAQPILLKGRPNIYSVTTKGFEQLLLEYDHGRQECSSGKISHDLSLVDIGQRIKSTAKACEYFTENQIQHQSSEARLRPLQMLRSDGGYLIKTSAHKEAIVAVEYEAAMKQRSRCVAKFMQYHYETDIELVLYICESQALKRKLMNAEETIRDKTTPKFFYTTLDDFLTNSKMSLSNRNGATIFLGEKTPAK